jgi:hypothetical protein
MQNAIEKNNIPNLYSDVKISIKSANELIKKAEKSNLSLEK